MEPHLPPRRPRTAIAKLIDIEQFQLTAIRELASFRDRRVLEIGCGDGRFTRDIAREAATVHAIDPEAAEVAKAQAAIPAEYRDVVSFDAVACADLDVEPCSIDLVFFSWSL